MQSIHPPTVSFAPRPGFRGPVDAVSSEVWALLACCLTLMALVGFSTSLMSPALSALGPQALAGTFIASLLARLLLLLPSEISSLRVPTPRFVQLAPGLAPSQRTLCEEVSRDFSSVFATEDRSTPRFGGIPFAVRASGSPWAPATRRVPRAVLWKERVRSPRSPRSRSVPLLHALQQLESEKRRKVRVGSRSSNLAARRSLAANSRIPTAEVVPDSTMERTPHIFDSVPDLTFELRREAFGAVASVPEKLHLLSQPRSQQAASRLSERPFRCFMMQVVRGAQVRARPSSIDQ
jgi:hypothetical protein